MILFHFKSRVSSRNVCRAIYRLCAEVAVAAIYWCVSERLCLKKSVDWAAVDFLS